MASARSGNEWFVRGEREREPVLPYSRGFHLEVNVMVRWSLRATRTIPQPEPRGMSVSGPRSAPGRQRNQFAVTCRTTTVFWNNINSPLHDIGPPLGNENPCWTALLLMGTPRFESLATGYVRLRDESGTRPWLSRTEVESGLIRWHEIIVLLLFSFFFLIASSSSSILRYRVDYWIDPWIILYIYCFVMLNIVSNYARWISRNYSMNFWILVREKGEEGWSCDVDGIFLVVERSWKRITIGRKSGEASEF